MEWFDCQFPDQLISRRQEHEWTPHLPDLNHQDFYLWGFLKDPVYESCTTSLPPIPPTELFIHLLCHGSEKLFFEQI